MPKHLGCGAAAPRRDCDDILGRRAIRAIYLHDDGSLLPSSKFGHAISYLRRVTRVLEANH